MKPIRIGRPFSPNRRIGFAIGNGESRAGFDLDWCKQFGPVVGCNAIYRDWTPDALVCVDGRMIDEAVNAGWRGPLYTAWMDYKTNKYTLSDWWTKKFIEGYTITKWAGGPVSVAVLHLVYHCEDIVLIGHDFNLSSDGTSKNLYLNTPNYDKTGDPARKQGHLVAAFQRLDLGFKTLQMYHAGPHEYRLPALHGRMHWMTHDELTDALTVVDD